MNEESLGCGCLFLIFGVVIGIALIFGGIKNSVRETVTDTVVKTERVQDGDDAKYLVFGEHEVYQNTDTIWFGKFNSSDFYRDIKVGHEYKFEVTGWRVPFLSWYRNIVKYEEVK